MRSPLPSQSHVIVVSGVIGAEDDRPHDLRVADVLVIHAIALDDLAALADDRHARLARGLLDVRDVCALCTMTGPSTVRLVRPSLARVLDHPAVELLVHQRASGSITSCGPTMPCSVEHLCEEKPSFE